MRQKWSHMVIAFLLVWLVFLILNQEYHVDEKSGDTVIKLQNEVNELKHSLAGRSDNFLSLPYEKAKRNLKTDIVEWWRYHIKKDSTRKADDDEGYYQKLIYDWLALDSADGLSIVRSTQISALSDLIQRRLDFLQNPADCSTAKKLVCHLNKGCGFGCQIHHAMYCFLVAYGKQRTLILVSKGWRYDSAGYENVYQPLSRSCPTVNVNIGMAKSWPGHPDDELISLPIVDGVNPMPPFLPPSIPADIADKLVKLHSTPIVWWVSQFLKYMLRPQDDVSTELAKAEIAQNIVSPVVGIHVRRTDKVGVEAAFHPVDEYMVHVAEYYRLLESSLGGITLPRAERRVFVASDDPRVLSECRRKYPNYVFSGDLESSRSASTGRRYSSVALRSIISDIHLLSKTDFIVCTFSSQVCRLAYEIMQQYHTDAGDRFKSLDDVWYYGGQSEHQQEAIIAHVAKDATQIELKIGDIIGLAGNHWNGWSKGRNHRTDKIGLFPSYKVKEVIKIISEFPSYPMV